MSTVRLSTTARNAASNAIVDLLDAGSGTATCTITVYGGSGSIPDSPDTAPSSSPTHTPLVTLTTNTTAFAAAANGIANLTEAAIGVASASGTAKWARFKDRSGTAVIDVDVGTSGTAVILSVGGVATDQIESGDTVSITAGGFTFPQGA